VLLFRLFIYCVVPLNSTRNAPCQVAPLLTLRRASQCSCKGTLTLGLNCVCQRISRLSVFASFSFQPSSHAFLIRCGAVSATDRTERVRRVARALGFTADSVAGAVKLPTSLSSSAIISRFLFTLSRYESFVVYVWFRSCCCCLRL
jgi:hypothetical protein